MITVIRLSDQTLRSVSGCMITVMRLSDTAVRVRLYDHCNAPVRHCGPCQAV